MNEIDRENQDKYNAMQLPPEKGYPRIEHGTAITYVLGTNEWEARWPTAIRLPVAGEWIIFEDKEGNEVDYAVKSVDWCFNATGSLNVRISLK
jgi:hypothetical protein